ncbi:Protein of unknown function [Alkalithermobacter thermoalcaliphilus JW-YL-7 = DSM 7308]|uniref:DUF1576 domain-containing protein n=1 Tax=Alkalithermobacter thermoalcaliphilus JW-YL-7 = DSM 7308 TaxID=1121328 RepID=A0A150FPE5_CLOPD|nr:protein of unknown function DUF1576 [[Clostridium] paradoxum JW-YL-7 = DSM 7308]SHK50943.1 Protein of unknown function [[Clostridium] paradoxum JW-YL-7 = DSM 7308]
MKTGKTSTMNIESYAENNIKISFMVSFSLSLIIFSFLVDTPYEIFKGVYRILVEPAALITDYIGVGGIGAAFFNSGLLTLLFTFLLRALKITFNGATFASLFLIAGFALFGKNLLNVWFIVIGVYLYSKVQRDKFSKYIYMALFGTAISPIVSEIMFNSSLPIQYRIPLSMLIGICIGFVLPPLSVYLLKVHQGFNLYNIGFTAGIIGTVVVSIFKSYGYTPSPRFIWSSGNNLILGSYLFTIFFLMIVSGFMLNNKSFNGIKNISKRSGRLITDFIISDGFAPTLINMGISGFISTLYVIIVGGDLNGPTIGGIFTVVGFSAFGKHYKNISPIFLGVILGSITKTWSLTDPAILLAALFGTALAPIAGEFGWKYGVLAGFIHSSVVLNVGVLHGGLNLYNNGFAAGIVAAVLIPIIEGFRKEEI